MRHRKSRNYLFLTTDDRYMLEQINIKRKGGVII